MVHAREAGDAAKYQRLRNRVVDAHLRFAVKIALRFGSRLLPLEDLVQEAAMGLARACDRFEPQREVAFSTYAAWWCRHAVQRAVANKAKTLRVPVYVDDQKQKCVAAAARFEAQHGRSPTLDELARAAELPLRAVQRAYRVGFEPVSMDAETLVGGDGSGRSLHDVTPSSDLSPFDTLLQRERRSQLGRLLSALSSGERAVMLARIRGLTAAEAAQSARHDEGSGAPGLYSLERIRQIERRAIRKMRVAARRAHLTAG
jgi:RNA polymerase primary sigma factor